MYSRKLDDQILTIAASGWTWNGKFVLQDLETGSLWWTGYGDNQTELMFCIAGEFQDHTLPRVYSYRGLWLSWFAAYPETKFLKSK